VKDNFVSRREAAEALGVSLKEVDDMISKAQGGWRNSPMYVKIRGRLRQVAGKSVDQIIEAQSPAARKNTSNKAKGE
jgi:transposase